jgi:hypothetical protein
MLDKRGEKAIRLTLIVQDSLARKFMYLGGVGTP